MRSLFLLATLATSSALLQGSVDAAPEDYLVLVSTWYPQACKSLKTPVCTGKTSTPAMRSKLVTEDLMLANGKDGSPKTQLCTYHYGRFWGDAFHAASRAQLVDKFPYVQAPSVAEMWDPEAPYESNAVPEYKYTCTWLSQEAYLKTTLQLTDIVRTPLCVSNNIGGEVDVASISQDMKKSVLVCDGKALRSIKTCWKLNVGWDETLAKATSLTQFTCPPAVKRTCPTSGKITIAKF